MKGLILIFVLNLLSGIIKAQNPTNWRGPEGNGIYSDTELLSSWPGDGPEILWHYDQLGDGFSSPVIVNGRIYVSGMEEPRGFIYCFGLNGSLEWKSSYGDEFYESYPGSRSTPVIDGNRLYIFSAVGVLTCMDASDGKILWIKDTFRELDGRNLTWGATETVVVDEKYVYCTPGGKQNNIIALNKINGELAWSSSGLGENSAYCTPLLLELPARKLLVTHTADHILGLDASNGKVLWSFPHPNQYAIHPNRPLYQDGSLYCFSGYGQGGVKLELNSDGSKVNSLWSTRKLDSRMGGLVLVDGYLYGSGDSSREWRCINWETGEETYADNSIGKGVVIYADGMLFCYSERGELALVKADPEGFSVMGKTRVTLGTAQHWAHPVINQGILYLRHGRALIAYKIK